MADPESGRDVAWGGCRTCRFFREDFTCAAFPQGIPIPITAGDLAHLTVLPGQTGTCTWELNLHPVGLSARLIDSARQRGEVWAQKPQRRAS
jgi:hypothetical protein